MQFFPVAHSLSKEYKPQILDIAPPFLNKITFSNKQRHSCHSTSYTARLHNRTTINRDSNGAKDITLIGFTTLISTDNEFE